MISLHECVCACLHAALRGSGPWYYATTKMITNSPPQTSSPIPATATMFGIVFNVVPRLYTDVSIRAWC
jgi:hypothetical protein